MVLVTTLFMWTLLVVPLVVLGLPLCLQAVESWLVTKPHRPTGPLGTPVADGAPTSAVRTHERASRPAMVTWAAAHR